MILNENIEAVCFLPDVTKKMSMESLAGIMSRYSWLFLMVKYKYHGFNKMTMLETAMLKKRAQQWELSKSFSLMESNHEFCG